MLTDNRLRLLTIALGVGTIAFGAFPLVFPRAFARIFDIPMSPEPAADIVIRSVSARDVVSGVGILSAVLHGGRLGPWLLARTLTDGADSLAIGIAFASGASSVRLGLLGVIALGATILDFVLYRTHRSLARSGVPPL